MLPVFVYEKYKANHARVNSTKYYGLSDLHVP